MATSAKGSSIPGLQYHVEQWLLDVPTGDAGLALPMSELLPQQSHASAAVPLQAISGNRAPGGKTRGPVTSPTRPGRENCLLREKGESPLPETSSASPGCRSRPSTHMVEGVNKRVSPPLAGGTPDQLPRQVQFRSLQHVHDGAHPKPKIQHTGGHPKPHSEIAQATAKPRRNERLPKSQHDDGGQSNVDQKRAQDEDAESHADDTEPAQRFKKRARHRTRTDRYDPKPPKAPKGLKKTKDEKQPHPRSRGSKARIPLPKEGSSKYISRERMTLKPSYAVGLFNRGRVSSTKSRPLEDLAYSKMHFLQKSRKSEEHVDEYEAVADVTSRMSQSDASEETPGARPSRPSTSERPTRRGRKPDREPEQDGHSSMKGEPASDKSRVGVVASSPPTGSVLLSPIREAGDKAIRGMVIPNNAPNDGGGDLAQGRAAYQAPSSQSLTWSDSVAQSDSEDDARSKQGAGTAERQISREQESMRHGRKSGPGQPCSQSQRPEPIMDTIPQGCCPCRCHAAAPRLPKTILPGLASSHRRSSSPLTDLRERSSIERITPLYEDVPLVLQAGLQSVEPLEEDASEAPAGTDYRGSQVPASLILDDPNRDHRGSTEPRGLEERPPSENLHQTTSSGFPTSEELEGYEVDHPDVTFVPMDMTRASARTEQPLSGPDRTSQHRTDDGSAHPCVPGSNLGIEETMAGFWRPHRLY
ncbi:MAG: hypothetical protein M1823_004544 [Watsoniomyces obsoletus]|nr:MAG: hypothetical protein M1823_004544 [Watsoniomyces obsoletus]